jgi:hypothetical protein
LLSTPIIAFLGSNICYKLCHVVDLHNASILVLCFMTTFQLTSLHNRTKKSHRHCLNIHKNRLNKHFRFSISQLTHHKIDNHTINKPYICCTKLTITQLISRFLMHKIDTRTINKLYILLLDITTQSG